MSFILIADDEEMIRSLAQEILTREGYEVLTASTPEEAKTLLREKDISLFLTDKDFTHAYSAEGLALAREAREQYPNLPIVMFSGLAATLDELPEGVDMLLGKPFQVRALCMAVTEAIAIHETPAEVTTMV